MSGPAHPQPRPARRPADRDPTPPDRLEIYRALATLDLQADVWAERLVDLCCRDRGGRDRDDGR